MTKKSETFFIKLFHQIKSHIAIKHKEKALKHKEKEKEKHSNAFKGYLKS